MNWRKLFVLLVVLISGTLMTAPVQAGKPETGNTVKEAYSIDLNETLSPTVGERTEVWFRYRGRINGLVQVSTCPTSYDTVLDAYTGRPGSPDFIWHADDGDACRYASNAMYTFQAEKGKAYYFKVTADPNGTSPTTSTTLTFSISAVTGGQP